MSCQTILFFSIAYIFRLISFFFLNFSIFLARHLLEQICQESSLVTKNAAETFLHRVKEESALHPDVTAIQDDAALVGHSFALLHIAADTDKVGNFLSKSKAFNMVS